MKRPGTFCMCGIALLFAAYLMAANEAAREMETAAYHFLAALGTGESEAASFDFEDVERKNWHYVPRERAGIPLKQLSPGQRRLVHSMLATLLSGRGLQKAEQIMYLDQILFEMENGNPIRDPDLYFFSLFGTPSSTDPWGWRFEGHHLSLNVTLKDGQIASTTPAFFGSNPARVASGAHRGLEVLAEEQEVALQLMRSLSTELRSKAVIDVDAPSDIVTRASVRAELEERAGLSFQEMDRGQAALVRRLIHVYADRFRPELASKKLEEVEDGGLENVRFAWAGGLERGKPHYYRIHGPRFVIEFDNTQNGANHVHSVWRDFENDFGEDVLHGHYHDPQGHHAGESAHVE